MESGNGQNNGTTASGTEDTWFVAIGAGWKFLCKSEQSSSDVYELHKNGATVKLREVLDMATPMQMVPQPGGATAVAKAFVLTRVDVTQFPVDAFLSLAGTCIYFLEDMNQVDREKYEAQIRVARGVTDAKDKLDGPRIVLPGMTPPPGFGRGRS